MAKKIMRLIAKFISNKRVLKLINSNRFRGAVVAAVNWIVNQMFPGLFEESIVAEIASYIIYALAGITASVGQIEASDRKYSEKEQRWKEEA